MDSIWIKLLEIFAAPATLIFGAVATILVRVIQIQGATLVDRKLAASQKKLQMSSDSQETLKAICRVAVSSAQQRFKSGVIKDKADKKPFAYTLAKAMRDDAGIIYDDTLLSEMIEGMLWDGVNGPNVTTTTTTTSSPPSTTSSQSSGMVPG
jgi:hypothetical protein